jgi:AcrR family transcriptional regulator
MSVKSRRQEYAEVTRSAIVDAAVERFTMEGYARTSIDAIAEAARVTKGGVYHHFADKAELFEAAFVLMEERLLAAVEAGTAGLSDPWELIATGIDIYLEQCCTPDFRRIALQDAPGALGWDRWKQVEERYFLSVLRAALDLLAADGQLLLPADDLTARTLLGALAEAGLAVAAAEQPEVEKRRAGPLVLRLFRGLTH